MQIDGWTDLIDLSTYQVSDDEPAHGVSPYYEQRHAELLEEFTVEELSARFEVGSIRKRIGNWVVTDYGLECLVEHYPIAKARLRTTDWLRHMAEKAWVDIDEFTEAFGVALGCHVIPIPPKQRYAVLQRDGYRCQLCGRNPFEDGVKLEVDHKVSRHNGGTNAMTNLHTLCFDCNRGKCAKDL